MHNNNNRNDSNNNNNNTINSSNLKNNYQQWCNNVAINLQHQQHEMEHLTSIQQQQHEQQQTRTTNWMTERNKLDLQQQHQQQYPFMQQYNNNNNSNIINNNTNHNINNQRLLQQQSPTASPNLCTMSQQYLQSYPQQQQQQLLIQQQQQLLLQQQQQQQQQLHVATTVVGNNFYYQTQGHQMQQQSRQPLAHSPYNSSYASSSPSPTHVILQQHQQRIHHSPHLPQQQQQPTQPSQKTQNPQHTPTRLVSMDGIQSGVPTLTTSTLTPTTLRSIEETFIHLTNEPINAPYQAGFIPPPLGSFTSTPTTTNSAAGSASGVFNNNSLPDFSELTNHDTESDEDGSQSSWNAPQFNEDNSLATTDNSSAATDSTSFQNGSNGLGGNLNSTSNASSTNDFTNAFSVNSTLAKQGANNNNNNNKLLNNNAPRRNMGGRRPTKSTNMTPEEEEKRRIRRERNKEAAARCRKRRVDQTNELQDEVAQLERKRENLQKDIESLNTAKQELEYILEAHRPSCQKIRNDLLSVSTIGGLIAPTTATTTNTNNNNNNSNNNNNANTQLALTTTTTTNKTRSMSPIDIKPIILNDQLLNFIKNEPLESALDSNSSLDHDGPSSPKRLLLSSSNNPMIPPPLPLPNVASITASLNTPIVTTAPVSFSSFNSNNATLHTLNTLNALNSNNKFGAAIKPRPNTLPTNPRNSTQLTLGVDGKAPTDINGVAIQTPSTGVFNFDSLMDGGTGLTPVSGPLVPTCSSQNKHPLELATPTSEPSKLVSL